MRIRTAFIAIVLLVVSVIAGAQSLTEDSLKSMLVLNGYKISYKGLDGKDLTFDEFSKLLVSGKQFETTKNTSEKTAVLKLEEAKSPILAKNNLKIASGSLVPDITGKTASGKPTTFQANSGKYTILSFYFSECAPCIQEIPDLNAFSEKHKDVNLIAVTFNSADEASEFKAKWNLKIDTIADAQPSIDTLGVKSYPTLVLISPDGKLITSKSGGFIVTGKKNAGLEELERWFSESKRKT